MQLAWKEVERLIVINAEHRKGFRLGQVSSSFVLQKALNEFNELCQAPDDIDELADLFGVLIHYAIKKGWSQEQLETAILEKFKKRFHESEPPCPKP